ncbi:MAG: hypothetical protein U9Q33_10800 [Campylobacterota bacterium]|nr:hypothetical protein [Campylobacterota bacterium]
MKIYNNIFSMMLAISSITTVLFGSNTLPIVESIAITSGAKDTLYSYELNASDVDGDITTWSVKEGTTLPSWLRLGGTISTTDGTITTVAGNGTNGYSGDRSAATSAQLNGSYGVAVDSSGTLYIADTDNHRVRKVDTDGTITTVAGTGTSGYSGDGSAATSAQLSIPYGVAVDSSGTLYIADSDNHRIRKVDTDGTITTVAGDGTSGYSGDDGAATSAQLSTPIDVAVDSSGNLYIADINNNRVRKVDTDGTITTVAGDGTDGYSGDDGAATSAQLSTPVDVAVDSSGNLCIADNENHRIRKVSPSIVLSGTPTASNGASTSQDVNLTLSDGNGGVAYHNFTITLSGFNAATTFNALNEVVTTDKAGAVTPFAGLILTDDDSTAFTATITLDDNTKGTLSATTIASTDLATIQTAIQAITFTPAENRVASDLNETTTITLTVSADGNDAVKTNTVKTISVNDTPVVESTAIISGAKDTLYSYELNASDLDQDTLTWSVTSGTTLASWLSLGYSYAITTVAGNGSNGYSGDGSAATSAKLYYPSVVAVDSSGNLYIADTGNHSIRKVDTDGTITTVAGTGTYGYSGDDGAATSAELKNLYGVAVDSSGNLYIADNENHRIRKVSPSIVLSGTPTDSNGASTSQDVNLTLSDGNGGVAYHNFTINISGFNNPTILSALTEISTNDNAGAVTPFSTLTLTDTDSTSFTATITLDDNAKGTLSIEAVESGTLSDVQTALRAVTFTPNENKVATGLIDTTTVTLTVSADGNDAQTTNTIVTTSVNDAPTFSLDYTNISFEEGMVKRIDLQNSMNDADFNSSLTVVPTSSNTNIADVVMDGDFLVIQLKENQTGTISVDLNLSDGELYTIFSLNVDINETIKPPMVEDTEVIDDNFEVIPEVTGIKPNYTSATEYKETIINGTTYAVFSDADESGKLSIMKKTDTGNWEYVTGYKGFSNAAANDIKVKYNKRKKQLSINFNEGSDPKYKVISAGSL